MRTRKRTRIPKKPERGRVRERERDTLNPAWRRGVYAPEGATLPDGGFRKKFLTFLARENAKANANANANAIHLTTPEGEVFTPLKGRPCLKAGLE